MWGNCIMYFCPYYFTWNQQRQFRPSPIRKATFSQTQHVKKLKKRASYLHWSTVVATSYLGGLFFFTLTLGIKLQLRNDEQFHKSLGASSKRLRLLLESQRNVNKSLMNFTWAFLSGSHHRHLKWWQVCADSLPTGLGMWLVHFEHPSLKRVCTTMEPHDLRSGPVHQTQQILFSLMEAAPSRLPNTKKTPPVHIKLHTKCCH